MNDKLKQRFAELEKQMADLKESARDEYHAFWEANKLTIDSEAKLNWEVKVKNLLEKACGGSESQHLREFEKTLERSVYTTAYEHFLQASAVFMAAKEDYDGGYCTSIRTLIQSEVFDSELEQAKELLANKYSASAAVIVGTVLETSLKELCDRHSIPHGKLDRMNADLVKASVYNAIVGKRVTALAGIRNDAAHGNVAGFTAADVKGMIDDAERFLAQNL